MAESFMCLIHTGSYDGSCSKKMPHEWRARDPIAQKTASAANQPAGDERSSVERELRPISSSHFLGVQISNLRFVLNF